MRRLEPVVWTKGTFLSPQHMQVQDRFMEDMLHFQTSVLEFRPWGFSTIRLDEEALAAGSVGITQAAGIFSDGLPFDIPASDDAPPMRDIAEHFEPDQNTVDVYLAIPQYRPGGFNFSGPARAAATRYRTETEMLCDENTGTAEKPVMLARKNFRLLFEGESLDGAISLRIARVVRTKAGLFQQDPQFVPPLLDFRASHYLMAIARRLVEILNAKSAGLAGTRRQKNAALAAFSASDVANFWLLYTVNTFLPEFRHLFETRGGHPETLFRSMLGLAGALTTFSTLQPRDLPLYDHDDLGRRFTDLDEKLRFLLETVIPSNFVSLPLKQIRPSIYATSIDREDYFKNTKMYLAIRSDANQGDLIARAPKLIKACSGDYIEYLVQHALPGIALTHTGSPPSAIPVKLDYVYFALSQSGGPWETVARARNMAVYAPSDFPNPQMELVILLPEKN